MKNNTIKRINSILVKLDYDTLIAIENVLGNIAERSIINGRYQRKNNKYHP